MSDARGEAQCPRCGSTNLTYKNVFDYFKCNDCRITFITPVYSYGENGPAGLDSAKDIASKIFGEAKSKEPEEARNTEPEVIREVPVPRVRRDRKSSTLSWLLFFSTLIILALSGVIIWLLFGDKISGIIY
jgi:hypothetical protein